MTQCKTCLGTYLSPQANGTRYFHACPPLTDEEVIAALAINVDRTKWTPLEAQTFAAASRVRPNARNENAPDVATLKPTIDAVPTGDPAKYWRTVNALRETSIVAAGTGTQ